MKVHGPNIRIRVQARDGMVHKTTPTTHHAHTKANYPQLPTVVVSKIVTSEVDLHCNSPQCCFKVTVYLNSTLPLPLALFRPPKLNFLFIFSIFFFYKKDVGWSSFSITQCHFSPTLHCKFWPHPLMLSQACKHKLNFTLISKFHAGAAIEFSFVCPYLS